MPIAFCRHLVGKNREMFVTVIALKWALLVSHWSYGHFLKITDSILFERHVKSSPFNLTHYIVLYPQNGDRIVIIDSVTSLQPVHYGPRVNSAVRLQSTSRCKKVADTQLPSVGFRSRSRFLAVSLHVAWVINLAVGCHYFSPGLRLPPQPLRGLLPVLLLGEQRHDGCEQFA